MADKANITDKDSQSFFDRLKKLFSTTIIIKQPGADKLKFFDMNKFQTMSHIKHNRLVPTASTSGLTQSGIMTSKYGFQLNKNELYFDYEIMDMDSLLSSALDIYADESTTRATDGNVLRIKSQYDDVQQSLENLFYDILDVNYNLWWWVRNTCKYGNHYMKLDIAEGIGVLDAIPLSPYAMTRIENYNDKTVEYTYDDTGGMQMYSSGRKKAFQDYEIVHFRLMADSNFLPYGKSILEPARRNWKQVQMMEDSMLINRIMRAPQRRIFYVDVGNLAPDAIDTYMQEISDNMKKIPLMDENTGEYNTKYNLMSMLEDFFIPVRGDKAATRIETLDGMEYTGIEDIKYLQNKMFAALKVPRAFLGFEEGINCIVPETKIPLLNGITKTVAELINDYENGVKNYVYSIDEETKLIVPGEIEWAGYTKSNTNIIRVWLDNNEYIDCTPDHKFLTRTGDWVEAQKLSENQALMPLYLDKTKLGYITVYHPATGKYQELHRLVAEYYDLIKFKSGKVVHHIDFNKSNNYPENFEYKNHTVAKIEHLSEKRDTCDITIKKYHNFATNAGVIIHNSKSTLSGEDVRFARTIERVQRGIEADLTKIAFVHLYVQGYNPEALADFELSLTPSSNIAEMEKLELLEKKIGLARDIGDLKLLSSSWIYDNLFHLTEDEMNDEITKLVDTSKVKWRLEQIATTGIDPVTNPENQEADGPEIDDAHIADNEEASMHSTLPPLDSETPESENNESESPETTEEPETKGELEKKTTNLKATPEKKSTLKDKTDGLSLA